MPEIDLPEGLSDTTVIIIVAVICGTFILTRFNWFPKIFRHSNSSKLDTITSKLDNGRKRLDANDRKWQEYEKQHDKMLDIIDDIQKTQLRNELLFQRPHSKDQHMQMINDGHKYVDEYNGNGAGHVRLKQLEDDFYERSQVNDWDYTGKGTYDLKKGQ